MTSVSAAVPWARMKICKRLKQHMSEYDGPLARFVTVRQAAWFPGRHPNRRALTGNGKRHAPRVVKLRHMRRDRAI